MDNEQKAMREPIEIPDELKRKKQLKVQGGETVWRGGRPGGRYLVQRPIQPTSRTQPQRVAFGRANAGHVVWRDIPSWHQRREPSTEQAIVQATKSPPWERKRRARCKARLQKASRKANRS